MVRDYRAGLGMPGTAKTAAISMIALVCSLSAFLAFESWMWRSIVLGAGAVGIGWIAWRVPTRPTGRPPLSPPGRWFRAVAFAEAVTWLGLLVGMAVKYLGDGSERGVEVFGPIHGVVVLVYLSVLAWTAHRLHWGARTTLLGLLASVPPGGTLFFEAWAERRLRLAAPRDRRGATLAS
jgi:integral membrane protein